MILNINIDFGIKTAGLGKHGRESDRKKRP